MSSDEARRTAMQATSRSERIDALNALQDELDAQEDYLRGPGCAEAQETRAA